MASSMAATARKTAVDAYRLDARHQELEAEGGFYGCDCGYYSHEASAMDSIVETARIAETAAGESVWLFSDGSAFTKDGDGWLNARTLRRASEREAAARIVDACEANGASEATDAAITALVYGEGDPDKLMPKAPAARGASMTATRKNLIVAAEREDAAYSTMESVIEAVADAHTAADGVFDPGGDGAEFVAAFSDGSAMMYSIYSGHKVFRRDAEREMVKRLGALDQYSASDVWEIRQHFSDAALLLMDGKLDEAETALARGEAALAGEDGETPADTDCDGADCSHAAPAPAPEKQDAPAKPKRAGGGTQAAAMAKKLRSVASTAEGWDSGRAYDALYEAGAAASRSLEIVGAIPSDAVGEAREIHQYPDGSVLLWEPDYDRASVARGSALAAALAMLDANPKGFLDTRVPCQWGCGETVDAEDAHGGTCMMDMSGESGESVGEGSPLAPRPVAFSPVPACVKCGERIPADDIADHAGVCDGRGSSEREDGRYQMPAAPTARDVIAAFVADREISVGLASPEKALEAVKAAGATWVTVETYTPPATVSALLREEGLLVSAANGFPLDVDDLKCRGCAAYVGCDHTDYMCRADEGETCSLLADYPAPDAHAPDCPTLEPRRRITKWAD